ncbi:MAG: citramalate synthase [Christensenellales bacterium]|jgi:2-isopropylmalate synthase
MTKTSQNMSNTKKLEILDTTLRDGAQAEGISFTVSDKILVVKALDQFGVKYIEAGNPGSNPKDMEFFERAASLKLNNAKLVAFGSTRRKCVTPEQDANVVSLLAANTPCVSIFGKSWDLHVKEILKTTLEENLCCVRDTLRFFKEKGKEVIFDAEHFFDGYLANPDYAISVLEAAVEGGADVLCLCDTNGGMQPLKLYEIVKELSERFPGVRLGIHCHNDAGCAVANSLLAVEAGCVHVQGTMNGIGERCGNADLSVIVADLQLKSGYECVSGNLKSLSKTCAIIAEVSNMSLSGSKPYVGASAFAHKGGMHIDGVDKVPHSFEHVDPRCVGNKRRFLLSEVSGKKAILLKVKDIAPHLTKESPETGAILERLKELEHQGYQFEAADASFELMVRRVLGTYKPHFNVSMYKTSGEFPHLDDGLSSNAMVKIMVDSNAEIAAAMGNGPVHALDQALRKAISKFYPSLSAVYLVDYKVRVLDSGHAAGSSVRVLIESTDGKTNWSTVGASTDIIEASFAALVDSLEFKLFKESEADNQERKNER